MTQGLRAGGRASRNQGPSVGQCTAIRRGWRDWPAVDQSGSGRRPGPVPRRLPMASGQRVKGRRPGTGPGGLGVSSAATPVMADAGTVRLAFLAAIDRAAAHERPACAGYGRAGRGGAREGIEGVARGRRRECARQLSVAQGRSPAVLPCVDRIEQFVNRPPPSGSRAGASGPNRLHVYSLLPQGGESGHEPIQNRTRKWGGTAQTTRVDISTRRRSGLELLTWHHSVPVGTRLDCPIERRRGAHPQFHPGPIPPVPPASAYVAVRARPGGRLLSAGHGSTHRKQCGTSCV